MDATAATPWNAFVVAYEAAHQDPRNRAVHHATHLAVFAALPLLWHGHPLAFAAVAALALPINWLAHTTFERNTPAFMQAGDAWQQIQIALGGLAWTAVAVWRRVRGS